MDVLSSAYVSQGGSLFHNEVRFLGHEVLLLSTPLLECCYFTRLPRRIPRILFKAILLKMQREGAHEIVNIRFHL